MTALMERPTESATMPVVTAQPETSELRAMLVAQGRTIALQSRVLESLDERREQLDELIADMMPIVNAMLLKSTRALEPLATADATARLTAAVAEIDQVRRAPPPGVLALLKQLRSPDVRRAIALTIAALGAVGRATATATESTVADGAPATPKS